MSRAADRVPNLDIGVRKFAKPRQLHYYRAFNDTAVLNDMLHADNDIINSLQACC